MSESVSKVLRPSNKIVRYHTPPVAMNYDDKFRRYDGLQEPKELLQSVATTGCGIFVHRTEMHCCGWCDRERDGH